MNIISKLSISSDVIDKWMIYQKNIIHRLVLILEICVEIGIIALPIHTKCPHEGFKKLCYHTFIYKTCDTITCPYTHLKKISINESDNINECYEHNNYTSIIRELIYYYSNNKCITHLLWNHKMIFIHYFAKSLTNYNTTQLVQYNYIQPYIESDIDIEPYTESDIDVYTEYDIDIDIDIYTQYDNYHEYDYLYSTVTRKNNKTQKSKKLCKIQYYI
jgi:hypothetical protein